MRYVDIKRKDFSIPSALMIVISQIISNFHSSENISSEIQKFRKEFQQSIVDRETYFVRKTDLIELNKRIDLLSSNIVRLNEQIKSMKEDYYSAIQPDVDVIGCSYMKEEVHRASSI